MNGRPLVHWILNAVVWVLVLEKVHCDLTFVILSGHATLGSSS